ncbi:unnamed protein product [Paramecium sonneborni]|uniref:Histone chaperone RTT106/FACT complex subunit SPT16-like middle domain-containing protein n=1 Tax=Paramecium sonneborni TaxID=65129 RepID=A0A8S1P650_9CILI|nr:unnamed protein product [Paramecium sonneborni]
MQNSLRNYTNQNCTSKNNLSCLRCSIVFHSSFLFPLEQSLLFIQKQIIYMMHSKLQRITQTLQNKFFDLKIIIKNTQNYFLLLIEKKDKFILILQIKIKSIDASQNGNNHKITLLKKG